MYQPQQEESNLTTLFKRTMGYVDTRLDLFKLSLLRKASEGVSSIISKIIALSLFSLALMLFCIGLSILIGKKLGGLEYGFFIVGGTIVIVGIIFYALRRKLIKAPISSTLINKGINS